MNRLLIADDEALALKRLEVALQCVPEMSIVAKASNGPEALTLIKQTKPDIAMLDINMPGRTGLEVAKGLKATDHVPEFIFVTGFEHHAVQAFEMNAVDYLVKPVPFDRLRESLRRAQERLKSRASEERFSALQEQLAELAAAPDAEGGSNFRDEIWVRERKGLTRIPTADIDMFEAAGDYVIAHVADTTHLLNESISSLQEKLDPNELLRVHRCSIVNVKRIRNLRRRGRRGLAVILANGAQVPVGPSYNEIVLRALDAKRWR